jgi:hypothetical protein
MIREEFEVVGLVGELGAGFQLGFGEGGFGATPHC